MEGWGEVLKRKMEEVMEMHRKKIEAVMQKMKEEIASLRRELKELRQGIPIFEGEDAYRWIVKVEQYFSVAGICKEDKISEAAQWLSGHALMWYQGWVCVNPNATWGSFTKEILERFQPEYDPNQMVWVHEERQESLEQEKKNEEARLNKQSFNIKREMKNTESLKKATTESVADGHGVGDGIEIETT
ncbi:NADH dehydrogenase [ubiquinone] flavoprotein 1 [Spatholobus suberectus]|nr:NADH dehydrogenase [ubiquinone] flavoprotein 1 [Spatholobus suberectus]